MDIRYTKLFDEVYLSAWLEHPKIAPYLICEGADETRNFKQHWMYYANRKSGLSFVENDRVVAMGMFILMPYQKVKHHAMLQIIVAPEHQKKGIGSTLLKNLMHLAKEYLNLEVIYVELLGPSPYLNFFKKRGFKVYAEQKGYVEGKVSDKILLEYSWDN